MPAKTLEARQAEMRERTNEQKFCRSCGSGLDQATVSVSEVIRYLEKRDSYLPMTRAAEYLGMSGKSLARKKSQIPHYRPGGKALFRRSDLDEWMCALSTGTRAD